MGRTIFGLLCLAGLVAGCTETNDDLGGDELASIRGTVTLTGDWPTTGEIQVSLFSQWHTEMAVNVAPQGPPSYATEQLNSPTPAGQTHVLAYEILDITPGTYPSLVVGWRDGGQSGLDEPVLGLYGADFATNDSLPSAIVLDGGDDFTLDFSGTLGRMPDTDVQLQPGQLGGSVSFDNGWPTAYTNFYVVFMTSANPGAPSMPLAMEAVTSADPEFLLTLQFDTSVTGHLVLYGYPYGTTPLNAFYGGYGWDWNATTPALVPITLNADQNGMGGLLLSCRTGN